MSILDGLGHAIVVALDFAERERELRRLVRLPTGDALGILRGKHEPRCNERCEGDWHYLEDDQ